MQAINAVYENGNIKWIEKPPMVNTKVIVIFTEETVKNENMSNEKALKILAEFKGCIKGDIDYEKERDEYLSEKYGTFD